MAQLLINDMNAVVIPLTHGMVALVDEADAPCVLAHRWVAQQSGGSRRGGPSLWHARAWIPVPGRKKPNGKTWRQGVLLHRFILGVSPGVEIDHENHDGLDCRRVNLRIVTRGQNMWNRRPNVRGASPFKGVSKNGTPYGLPWIMQIQVNGQRLARRYATEQEAAEAYDALARQHFGEHAFLNGGPRL
jgi:hypothetical protein